MIGNLIKCEKCNNELQPEDIGIGIEQGNLIRVCCYCGNKVNIEEKKLEVGK